LSKIHFYRLFFGDFAHWEGVPIPKNPMN